MTEKDYFILPMASNNNMTNMFRPSFRNFFIFFIIYIIGFSFLVVYLEQSKWDSTERTLNNLAKTVKEQNELIEQIYQFNDKLVNDVNSKKKTVNKNLPTIFAITPTFARPVQKAELTRLAQAFLQVPNFHWIVVEDSATRTNLVTNFLWESGLNYQHLNVITPSNYKLGINDPHWKKPRGVAQRNAALNWLRNNYNTSTNGVVYFADDDNTYSIKLFKEMEKIKVVGVWPVGLVGGLMVERPICDNTTNKVIGFNSVWKPERSFPLDMAGFAINLKILLEKKDTAFSFRAKPGYQESEFLEQLVTRDQLEPLADCCTKVYVWHTRTESPPLRDEQRLIKMGKKSNDNIEI
ncbi:GSCOCG00000967001-RA-CDS [Cotesia congregata]|uniref:Galactosylgalactosylxylosylprotein 3-beta-glucuronosyltransferase n=1 Tax=Cotesia congregata TaxID=51543 RepID=A0A8J2HHQ1_COTCN|nr:GSCOCG00000967001-RA-CDS [Cotesia congregata]CAG5095854.1 Similar to GlcAT-I: Galactosylgalactosylxylosylprotein 3-beta-glucuronosyltransferase I (Drosophila melanogaster) [Cotesia congregata]